MPDDFRDVQAGGQDSKTISELNAKRKTSIERKRERDREKISFLSSKQSDC